MAMTKMLALAFLVFQKHSRRDVCFVSFVLHSLCWLAASLAAVVVLVVVAEEAAAAAVTMPSASERPVCPEHGRSSARAGLHCRAYRISNLPRRRFLPLGQRHAWSDCLVLSVSGSLCLGRMLSHCTWHFLPGTCLDFGSSVSCLG